jgi:hypothetical protein
MSKCQINKYKAGGRCGGTSGSASEGYTSAEFTAYLTKRQEQDRLFSATATASSASSATTATAAESKAIVIQKPPQINRKKDIDDILNGDFLE